MAVTMLISKRIFRKKAPAGSYFVISPEVRGLMARKKQSRGTRAVFWSNGFRKILFDKVHGCHPDIQNDELHGLNATITRTTTHSISYVISLFETVQTVEKMLRNLTDI